MPSALVTVVDIGHDSVKVVSVRRRKGGAEVVGATLARLPALERGKERDPAEVGALVRRLVRRDAVPVGRVFMTLGGRGTMLRYPSIPVVPPWQLKLVMNFEVEELVSAAGGLEAVAYDYRILGIPGFDENAFPVLVALGQVGVIEERFAAARAAKLPRPEAGLAALGAFNLYRLSPQCRDDAVTLLLDVGAEETQLTLSQGEQLFFARTCSVGGRAFTARVASALGLAPAEAEAWKRRHAAVLPPGRDEWFDEPVRLASDALRSEAAALVTQINGSLRFFAQQLKVRGIQPARLLVTGGGGELAGLPEYLGRQLRIDAERFRAGDAIAWKDRARQTALSAAFHDTPVSGSGGGASGVGPPGAAAKVVNPAAAASPGGWEEAAAPLAAAAGLAAGIVGGERLTVSLVPPKETARRDFWSRRVFTYYAAGLAAFVLVFLGLRGCPGPLVPGYYLALDEQRRADAWTAWTGAAEGSKKELDELATENRRLGERYNTLMARVRAGRVLEDALAALQRETPAYIVLSGVTLGAANAPVDAAIPQPAAGGGPLVLEGPVVTIKGYIYGVGDVDPKDPTMRLPQDNTKRFDRLNELLNDYIADLSRTGALSGAGLRQSWTVGNLRNGADPTGDEKEIRDLLALFVTGDRAGDGPGRKPPDGLARRFDITARLAVTPAGGEAAP